MSKKLEARVKDSYNMGSVVAFSGHEYARNEWREVPAGFEDAAIVHPLLDVRDAETQKENKVTAKDHLADTLGTADLRAIVGKETVSTETEPVEEEPPAEKKPARRKSKSSGKEE